MKIIVPMAGIGSRLRPHTLTIPKPLVPVGGKPIVQRLVEDIAEMSEEPIDEIAFIIGDFGEQVKRDLKEIAANLGAEGKVYYQEEALGTAHAILCADKSLEGNIIVAFADTLFRADFKLDKEKDGVIYVKQIDDPSAFGIVKLDENNHITDFVEKPETFITDLAIIGIYYFKDGNWLKEELKYLIDNNIKDKGEFQLTNALENMKEKGAAFVPGKVNEWLDCGNKDATVHTNQRILELDKNDLVASSVKSENSVIIPPCFIGENVQLKNSVVGPHVSIGAYSIVKNSIVKNSIIQKHSIIEKKIFKDSMIGNNAKIEGTYDDLSLGDFSQSK
ncbi:MAG: sugar phosphate nucleotidyltransferase [Chitinophagales bacterium]